MDQFAEKLWVGQMKVEDDLFESFTVRVPSCSNLGAKKSSKKCMIVPKVLTIPPDSSSEDDGDAEHIFI